ncbi:phage tail spike protein [Staphylococcus hominis]|uniref:phage tail spike protein n=1 Tax=Staphylococcus hominis TaxID=1290 RepID=UPI001F5436B7|nr:phage tail spike protein [Staphylococcus hominis]
MIHILDFNDNIIDFISRDDGAVTKAEMTRNVQEMVETLDFTVLSERADNLRERNRVIAQDYNGVYREFIITHVEDDLEGLTDVKCNASYLEDLATAKPLEPQTFEKMSTTQALLKTLADTGWEVSDETEYGGMRSKSWTSYNNPYQVVGMLETTYDMVADFYIELGSHTVEHRYVSLKHPSSLFKGKEIVKGKDLIGLTRTVDTSEVRTALIALGPEDEKGNRISTIVKDDDAHEQFGLPGRYLWDIYEPESEDTNMTLERLTTLAKTELNKRKQMSVSYEISALDIHRYYNDVQVELRDKVRVKDRDFNPPLYVEAEVLAFTYNLILDDTTFTFGNVVEFEEDTLRQEFTRRLDEIRKKLQDDISNVNTIVNDAVEGQLEYFEPKIIKSDEAPEKPVEDMLWYDTSNPDVAVLRRYVNGEWKNETAKDVEQLGGMTREKVLYNSLTNTFANLNIQHSKLLDEVYKLLNNEYLVDDELRLQLDNAMNNIINVYNNIKTNLDSMTLETATIGKLIDTQALFVRYRERLQDLYKAMRNAQIAADDRLKLLQSQYTDEKFNDAMNKIAETLPNGRWDSENQQLYADIPNEQELSNLKQTLQDYYDGNIKELEGRLNNSVDSKVKVAKDEISANVKSVESRINGVQTRVDTTESNISALKGQISLMAKSDDVAQKLRDVDGRLTPLETTVQSNKATLDILPTQIDSKVSKQDYTLDKDNIVQRLDNADSQRKQLSNEITDKVTITEFNSGMDATANYLESYADDKVDNLSIGSENLLLNSESRSDGANTTTHSFIRYYLTHPLEIGKTYTLKADVVTTDERQSGQTSVYPYNPNGKRDTVDIKDGKIIYTFTAQSESTEFLVYKDIVGQSNVDLNVTIEKAILVEGDKVTGWMPANEDVKKDIQQAETNAKAYTDDYKNKNEIAMTKLETSVSQLDGEVSIKVDEQKFNASQKTLSKVLTEIAATTSGINLTYDNNGAIQGVTVGNGGVKLRGDKVDITVNDEFRVMANRVSNVQSDVSNKVGKDDIINRLNLSPEGLDIDVSKIGIRGGDNIDYIDIRDNSILSYGVFTRTWANETDTANLRLGIQGGTVKIQNRTTGYNLYLTEKGLSTMLAGAGDETAGTLEFHSTKYNDRSRGVRLHSTYGAVALESDYSRIILNSNLTTNIESNTASVYIRPFKDNRVGVNEFRFWTKLADKENETDGVLSYGAVTELPDGTLPGNSMGASLRFEKNPRGSSTVYATNVNGDIGTGSFYAHALYGDWIAKNTNLYAEVGNELRITDLQGYNGGKPNYMSLRASTIRTTSSYAFSNHSGGDTYFGVGGGELRVTDNNHYNGGKTSYRNIRFGKWYAMSSEKYKYDIKEWSYSVLDAFRNDLQLYSFKHKSDKESNYIRNHHGVIIERELPIEWRHGDGIDGNEIMFWNTKAIQELIAIVDEQNGKINKLEEEVKWLKTKI